MSSNLPFSFYLQHFADTFRQSVIDLLQGNLEDIRDIIADDPIAQFTNIAKTAIIPDTQPPQKLDFGVFGNDLKFALDTFDFTRFN
jgi:hypothetical protein